MMKNKLTQLLVWGVAGICVLLCYEEVPRVLYAACWLTLMVCIAAD